MYRSRALVAGPRKHLHRVGDKMAALRVVVLSGNGRALLSTSKTTKTLTVGRCLSISFNCLKNLSRQPLALLCGMSGQRANISLVVLNGATQGQPASEFSLHVADNMRSDLDFGNNMSLENSSNKLSDTFDS